MITYQLIMMLKEIGFSDVLSMVALLVSIIVMVLLIRKKGGK